MHDFATKNRPDAYPFTLDPTGNGAPRFTNGKLSTQRNWKVLSPYENSYSKFQKDECQKAQGE